MRCTPVRHAVSRPAVRTCSWLPDRLDAKRIDGEKIAPLSVVKCIQHDDDLVILHDRISFAQARADPARTPVHAHEGDVQIARVIGEVRGCLLCRGLAIVWLALTEFAYNEGDVTVGFGRMIGAKASRSIQVQLRFEFWQWRCM